MKNIILFVVTILLVGVSCKQQIGITGTFIGLTNDTLFVRINVLNDEYKFESGGMDTVIVQNGQFYYNPKTNSLTELTFYPLDNINLLPSGAISTHGGGIFVLLYSPGDRIHLNANNDENVVSYHVKGNRYSEQLSSLKSNTNLLNAYKQVNALNKIINDNSFTGDKTAYREQRRDAMKVVNDNPLDYICANPDEPLSAYLISSFATLIESDKIFQYTDSLGFEALSSVFGSILRQKIEFIIKYKEENEKTGIAKKEMIDKPAPEFTLQDINGKHFSLSSLRGKYVVLDFWGSWCPWCLVDFPYVKKYYADHPNEFEIVGIAFSDKKEEWRKVVLEKYTLPWINVFDDDDLHTKYFITSAPSYVLIDKEGFIMDFPMSRHEVIKHLNELREKRKL